MSICPHLCKHQEYSYLCRNGQTDMSVCKNNTAKRLYWARYRVGTLRESL